MARQTKILPIALLASLPLAAPALAQAPVALVEDVGGKPQGVEFMDYVAPGKVIRLGPGDSIVLGYLRTCWRESIRGGMVTVGHAQSEVQGGTVDRVRVECDGGRMELAAAQAKQSAAAVVRKVTPPRSVPRPQFTIYGRTPVVELKGGGRLVLERVDVAKGERLEVTIARAELVRGAFYDLLRAGKSLKAGGIYRATVGDQQIVFEVDKGAKEGAEPLAGRLLRFQPTS
ncbi:MAG: hypothetical protein KF889_15460 [Alphaproteobacteria bacterium]|nr:hypothetical protein [Alphaproteobacteria bacterium]MCW5740234.1 hypothetical protein [Alphaproteobacteria bacterium]